MASRRDTRFWWISCDTCFNLASDGESCRAGPGPLMPCSEDNQCEKWRCATCALAFEDDPTVDHGAWQIFTVVGANSFVVGPSPKKDS